MPCTNFVPAMPPQYGVLCRAIFVARSLSRWQGRQDYAKFAPYVVPSLTYKLRTVHEMRDTNVTHVNLTISSYGRDKSLHLRKIFWHLKIFATTWRALLHLTRIATRPHAHCHDFFPHWHAKLRRAIVRLANDLSLNWVLVRGRTHRLNVSEDHSD